MAERMPWGLKSDRIAPPSMKGITESKLKAFNIGTMNLKKGGSRREQEEKKKQLEVEETEAVYKEFIESFEDTGKQINKSWVKGDVVNPSKEMKRMEAPSRMYKPKSKLSELASTFSSAQQAKANQSRPVAEKPIIPGKKKPEKKKTNLELFKEELRAIQEERQERRKLKTDMGIAEDPSRKSRFEPPEPVATGSSLGLPKTVPQITADDYRSGSYNYADDVMTTNLYLGNINPKMSEQQLCECFGRFGPLASVKIMWPRSEEERSRNRNCGFVAFMNRKDGERALAALQGKDIQSFEMKLGWGKAIPIPPHPIYIPPALAELSLPPPPSGLPFNAQESRSEGRKSFSNVAPPRLDSSSQESLDYMDKTLAKAVVKVIIPTDRNLAALIHRMVEFVVREGPMFEAMIMNRELNNPQYRFLFENQSPAHVYYRWKLFSILQGDDIQKWRTPEFRMFKDGSLWRPPTLNPYTQGMPDELVGTGHDHSPNGSCDGDEAERKGQLSESQRDRLEDLLRELTPERPKIGDAMVWCLDHATSSEEIVECITEALSILQTPLPKKIARLYLVSDILHNSSAKVSNASFFRKYFEAKLPEIFKDVHAAYENIEARLKAENFKQKVLNCFRAWEDWAIYPNDFLIRLQNVFLGLSRQVESAPVSPVEEEEADMDGMPLDAKHDVDGAPLREDVDVDGMPLEADLDGDPMSSVADVDGQAMDDSKSYAKFVPSKWESVDQSLLEAQAVTTSKWEDVEDEEKESPDEGDDLDGQPMEEAEEEDSRNGSPESQGVDAESGASTPVSLVPYGREDDSRNRLKMNEERRNKLREIEVKVMKYQDEVEVGKRSRKSDMSMVEQVEHYRKKLLAKEEGKERGRRDHRDRSRNAERSGRHRESERRVQQERSSDEEGQCPEDNDTPYRGYNSEQSPVATYHARSPSPPPFRGDRSRARHRSRSPRRLPDSPRRMMKRSRSRTRSPMRHRHKHKKRH